MMIESGCGIVLFGLIDLFVWVSFVLGNWFNVMVFVKVSWIGMFDVNVMVLFVLCDGVFGIVDDGLLLGCIDVDILVLKIIGNLFGLSYLFGGCVVLKLMVFGMLVKLNLLGMLMGDELFVMLID